MFLSKRSQQNTSSAIIKSSTIFNYNEPLSKTSKSSNIAASSITNNDNDTSIIIPTSTVSTNLKMTDDDNNDDQSKLINEPLKRSSLGLALDSLELLRTCVTNRANGNEQIVSEINVDNTPWKRKSALKSHCDSLNNIRTPEFVSYIAIDEISRIEKLISSWDKNSQTSNIIEIFFK